MSAEIRVCSYYQRIEDPDGVVINTCSRGKDSLWRQLSPFLLGPVPLYEGRTARNMENGWQFSKTYPEHADAHGNPTPRYWEWAEAGWANPQAIRYPMGKGRRPLYSLWNGERLDYVAARKRIYVPLYANAVKRTAAFRELRAMQKTERRIWLRDFDGYDHVKLGMSLYNVLNEPRRKMGHAFVLAMLLDDCLDELLTPEDDAKGADPAFRALYPGERVALRRPL